jgi:hypothetical protein
VSEVLRGMGSLLTRGLGHSEFSPVALTLQQ